MLLEVARMTAVTISTPKVEWIRSDLPGSEVTWLTHDASGFPSPAVSNGQLEEEWDESRARTPEQLKLDILRLVTAEPGLDDVEIADRLGEIPFEVSRHLRSLAGDDLIAPAE